MNKTERAISKPAVQATQSPEAPKPPTGWTPSLPDFTGTLRIRIGQGRSKENFVIVGNIGLWTTNSKGKRPTQKGKVSLYVNRIKDLLAKLPEGTDYYNIDVSVWPQTPKEAK